MRHTTTYNGLTRNAGGKDTGTNIMAVRKTFREALKDGPLVFDGAMGTALQKLGMEPGGCPDELNLTEPEMVKKVYAAFKEAGSDIFTTNTFGATRPKLKEYNLEGKLREINIAAVKNIREAVGEDGFVAGDIGPTGHFIEPVGDLDFDAAVEIFTEQANALKEGGADLLIIETMMDIKEMRAAIIGAKTTGLPVVATMTFDQSMRTILGTTPEVWAIVATGLGVDALGANCSLGIEGLYEALSAMSAVTNTPLIAQPNAGIPELVGKETVFPATPEQMTEFVPNLVAIGVRILGGCCGTTPEHIKQMGADFRSLQVEPRQPKNFTALASRTSVTCFGGDLPPITIGERINPTGRKKLAQEIKDHKTTTICRETKEQTEAGANVLDVNVGVPDIDEPAAMKRAVFAVNDNTHLPIVVDSPNLAALEEGLKAVDGRALINSVSGEEEKLAAILPLAVKYGAAVLGLTIDDEGIPPTAEDRFKVAEKIMNRALEAGLKKEDLVIDCLAMTVSADPQGAITTLKAIRMVKERLGLSTTLGVSNISFGLPSRESVNSHFYSMALHTGLDSAIMNVKNQSMMDSYHASLVLLTHDAKAEKYIGRFKDREPGAAAATTEEKAEPVTIQDKLIRAVVDGDTEHILDFVEEALADGWEPLVVGNDGLILGLNEVGRLFAANIYFLPQVISSADAVKKAFARLKEEMKEDGGPKLGKVIMATVKGDIHDIGKNIVCTLLENHGFEVLDLGKNVPTEKIVEVAKEQKVDIVGLSALMTTTVMEMENVIQELQKAGVPAKVMIGGAVVTQEFADRIKAIYGGEATAAVDKMKEIVEAKSAKT